MDIEFSHLLADEIDLRIKIKSSFCLSIFFSNTFSCHKHFFMFVCCQCEFISVVNLLLPNTFNVGVCCNLIYIWPLYHWGAERRFFPCWSVETIMGLVAKLIAWLWIERKLFFIEEFVWKLHFSSRFWVTALDLELRFWFYNLSFGFRV